MARDSEVVTVKIEGDSPFAGVELLPDVLRQLNAMIRLLTDFSNDPRYSRVQVLHLHKGSPLEAQLRVVKVPEAASPKDNPSKKGKQRVKPAAQPLRRLEKAYAFATGVAAPKKVDPEGLVALGDFAKQLRSDVATIQTERSRMVVSSSLIDQIDRKLGPAHRSFGSVTGVLEGLNIHTRPWNFTIYPTLGPSKVRCTFRDDLFESVQSSIGKMVTVRGLKDYYADSKWPARMSAETVEARPQAAPGAWLDLIESLAALQADAEEFDFDRGWEEQIA